MTRSFSSLALALAVSACLEVPEAQRPFLCGLIKITLTLAEIEEFEKLADGEEDVAQLICETFIGASRIASTEPQTVRVTLPNGVTVTGVVQSIDAAEEM